MTFNLSVKHPQYTHKVTDWTLIQDCYDGEGKVKDRGQIYLKPTSGMEYDGMSNASDLGYKMYESYKLRAVFPDLIRDAVEAMVGLMHRKPAVIKVPKGLEDIIEEATRERQSCQALLQQINEQQLLYGRMGILVDIPTGAGPTAKPLMVPYSAKEIVNWDVYRDAQNRDVLGMLVLDESGPERDVDLSWQDKVKHRLMLAGPTAVSLGGTGEYITGVATEQTDIGLEAMRAPSLAGQSLRQVPFVIIGARDLAIEPDNPPLLGVARLAMTIYRSEADYRQALFMQSQETLALIGAMSYQDEARRVGAGAVLELPLGGDAKYIGVSADGLQEQRTSLENDYKRANEAGAQLLESRGKAAESGDALRVRVAARTATLTNVARVGAEGLQQALQLAAQWRGLDPNEVEVIPNLDFTELEFNIQDLVYFMDARERGIPFSLKSIHRYIQRRDGTDMSYEDEIKEIIKERQVSKVLRGPPPTGAEQKAKEPSQRPATGRSGTKSTGSAPR